MTADDLIRLSESNDQVSAELAAFEQRVQEIKTNARIGGMTPEDVRLIGNHARLSAEALSGYGIEVSVDAFVAFADLIEPDALAA